MDKDLFLEKIKEIGTSEDDVNRRSLLSELSEDVSKVFDSLSESSEKIEALNKTIEQNIEDMESLRKANMDLFKRIGANKSEDEKAQDNGQEVEKPKRRFENLFDEKGMIKR